MTVVLVPVSRDQLDSLREEPLAGPVTGFTVTAALRDTFGLSAADDEEADRTALLLAGLRSLMSNGKRVVLVVDASPVDDGDPLGEVTLPGISWKDVSAFFADASEAALLAAATARAVAGLDLDVAWDTDAAQALMGEHDLLWYGPEEVGAFLSTWTLAFLE
jgi:hypothetical protein